MPPLATNELDPTAIQLLTDWITQSLPQRQSFSDWQIENFGSTSNPNAAPDADPDGDGQTNLLEFFTYTNPNSAASASPLPALTSANGQLELSFTQPANRAALIQTSTDLTNWTLWDVPGNSPSYAGMAQLRTFMVPLNEDKRFFRLQLSAP